MNGDKDVYKIAKFDSIFLFVIEISHSLLQFHLNFITIKNSSFNSTIVYYLYIFASTSSLQFFQPYCDALACTFYTLSIFAVFTVLHQSYFLNFSFVAPMFFLFFTFQYLPLLNSKKVNIGATSRKFKK